MSSITVRKIEVTFYVKSNHAGKGAEFKSEIEEEFSASSVRVSGISYSEKDYLFFVTVPVTLLENWKKLCDEKGIL